MTDSELLDIFRRSKALLEGHFLLSSGLHSANYMQCALLLQDPKLAEKICAELAAKLSGDKISVVVGPALGGVVVAYEVARALGVCGIFTERVDGKMTLRRGFSLGEKDRVLICEDVITTGKSTKEVVEVVKSYGAKVAAIASIVDRSGGTADFGGVPFKSLLKIDIPAYAEAACPLCAKKIPVVKPGSRAKLT